LDEEGVPKELNASQLWEVAWCFDNMNYRNKETKRHTKPGTETEAGAAGQRRGRGCVQVGRGGCEPGFLPDRRLFLPDNFWFLPALAACYRMLPHNFFAGRGRESENHGGTEAQSHAEEGVRSQEPERASCVDFRGKKFGLLRESSRSFTKVRTDQARNSAMFGFPSPPRDGCPRDVVRLRETWSHCYG
jgi:hypothetical protein